MSSAVSMESKVFIIETLEAKEGKTEQLKNELARIVPIARKEVGCITYDLYQDKQHSHKFAVIMCWNDQQAYEKHINAEYIKDFEKKFESTLYQNVKEHFYTKLQ